MTELQLQKQRSRATALLLPVTLAAGVPYGLLLLFVGGFLGSVLRFFVLGGYTAALAWLFTARLWPAYGKTPLASRLRENCLLTFLIYFILLALLWCFEVRELLLFLRAFFFK